MLRSISLALRGALVAIPLILFGGGAAAQSADEWNAAGVQMSRAELEALLARFEETGQTTAYSADLRGRAQQEARLIRTRLEEGDFQVGDRIVLAVEGEPTLTNTFIVGQDRILTLPTIGDISLRGVLRSELQPYLMQQIGRQIKNPVVQAQSQIRISILGSVAKPGFFVVPSASLLTDAIMEAGGPTRDAKLTRIYIEREGQRIWEGEPLQQAIIEGRTLDQLSLRAGDRVYVPGQTQQSGVLTALRNVGIITGLVWTVVRVAQYF